MRPLRLVMVTAVGVAALLAARTTGAQGRGRSSTTADEHAAADPPADRLLQPSVVAATRLVRSLGGFDLFAGVRERALPSVVGSEIDAQLSLVRRAGALSVMATGAL